MHLSEISDFDRAEDSYLMLGELRELLARGYDRSRDPKMQMRLEEVDRIEAWDLRRQREQINELLEQFGFTDRAEYAVYKRICDRHIERLRALMPSS